MAVSGPGGNDDPGHFTMPGGRFANPETVAPSVTNHPLVPLDHIIFHHLHPHQIKEIKLSMLAYSRDASLRLAQAYTEILAIIDV